MTVHLALPRGGFLINSLLAVVDRLFLRERWRSVLELQRFSREARDIRDVNQLAATLVPLVTQAMKAERALILVPHVQEDVLVVGHSVGIRAPRAIRLQRSSCQLEVPVVGGSFLLTMHWTLRTVHVQNHSPVWSVSHGQLHPWLAQQDRPVSMQDLVVLPQWQGLPQGDCAMLERIGSEYASYLVVPLLSKGVLTSLLFLGPRVNGHPYSAEDVDMLQTLAHHGATAVENARLYEQLRLGVQELELAQAQLVRSAKLVATGELVANVAHEVNNPLQSILNITYLLSLDLQESPLQADVQLIGREVERARGIVGGLLDFARQGDASGEWVDVNKLLASVLTLVHMRIHGGDVSLSPSLPPSLRARERAWGFPSASPS